MENAIFFDYDSVFSSRLRSLIEEKNISKQKLADEIGVSRQAISQYCDGSTVPNADKLLKIAEYFNVSLDFLVGKTEAKTDNKDVQFICDYTRLSEEAVKALSNEDINTNGMIKILNKIILDSKLLARAELYNIWSGVFLTNFSYTKSQLELLDDENNEKKIELISEFNEVKRQLEYCFFYANESYRRFLNENIFSYSDFEKTEVEALHFIFDSIPELFFDELLEGELNGNDNEAE